MLNGLAKSSLGFMTYLHKTVSCQALSLIFHTKWLPWFKIFSDESTIFELVHPLLNFDRELYVFRLLKNLRSKKRKKVHLETTNKFQNCKTTKNKKVQLRLAMQFRKNKPDTWAQVALLLASIKTGYGREGTKQKVLSGRKTKPFVHVWVSSRVSSLFMCIVLLWIIK